MAINPDELRDDSSNSGQELNDLFVYDANGNPVNVQHSGVEYGERPVADFDNTDLADAPVAVPVGVKVEGGKVRPVFPDDTPRRATHDLGSIAIDEDDDVRPAPAQRSRRGPVAAGIAAATAATVIGVGAFVATRGGGDEATGEAPAGSTLTIDATPTTLGNPTETTLIIPAAEQPTATTTPAAAEAPATPSSVATAEPSPATTQVMGDGSAEGEAQMPHPDSLTPSASGTVELFTEDLPEMPTMEEPEIINPDFKPVLLTAEPGYELAEQLLWNFAALENVDDPARELEIIHAMVGNSPDAQAQLIPELQRYLETFRSTLGPKRAGVKQDLSGLGPDPSIYYVQYGLENAYPASNDGTNTDMTYVYNRDFAPVVQPSNQMPLQVRVILEKSTTDAEGTAAEFGSRETWVLRQIFEPIERPELKPVPVFDPTVVIGG